MDIAATKPVERVISIVHPVTGEDTGITVHLMSIQDERMKRVKRRIQDERMKLERRGKSFDASQQEDNILSLIFHSMTGWEWSGDVKFHGEKPAFNEVNVKKVLTELYWFQKQIDEALDDEKAFFQTSEPDSKKPSASTPATTL